MILTDYTFEELKEQPIFSEEKPFRIKQLLRWVYTKLEFDFGNMTDLSKEFRGKLKENVKIIPLEKINEIHSFDGTTKYAFRLNDGFAIESVLIPMNEGKVTFCISSQVGCAMGCKFCKTATMGLLKNLKVSEIVGQVLLLKKFAKLKEKQKFNIVFMGMGEPLNNLKNVLKAIDILTDEKMMDLSPRRITVSTSGIIDGIKKLGEYPKKVRLAISLNAPDDSLRERIMPVNRGNNLKDLIRVLKDYPLPKRDRITFEYVMLKDFNDKKEHALKLYNLLKGLKYKINLIPFNPFPESKYKKPDEKTVLEFQKVLTDRGVNAIIRKSKGEDISAACGMLASKNKKE